MNAKTKSLSILLTGIIVLSLIVALSKCTTSQHSASISGSGIYPLEVTSELVQHFAPTGSYSSGIYSLEVTSEFIQLKKEGNEIASLTNTLNTKIYDKYDDICEFPYTIELIDDAIQVKRHKSSSKGEKIWLFKK